ncbi:MAG: hypothetical protein ABI854_10365 [Betaproteobacteria bacterium]
MIKLGIVGGIGYVPRKQGVQEMNLIFGLPGTTGLMQVPVLLP